MLNFVEPMKEIKRRREAYAKEAEEKLKVFDEAYKVLFDMNEACPNCDGQGKKLRSRACAEDDAPDPNDPRDWNVCTWCGGSGRVTKEKKK